MIKNVSNKLSEVLRHILPTLIPILLLLLLDVICSTDLDYDGKSLRDDDKDCMVIVRIGTSSFSNSPAISNSESKSEQPSIHQVEDANNDLELHFQMKAASDTVSIEEQDR